MVEKKVTVGKGFGGEKQSVARLVQLASRFESSIYLLTEHKRINAKSIMGMMGMGMQSGKAVTVAAEGADEEAAASEVAGYLEA